MILLDIVSVVVEGGGGRLPYLPTMLKAKLPAPSLSQLGICIAPYPSILELPVHYISVKEIYTVVHMKAGGQWIFHLGLLTLIVFLRI